MLAIALLFSPHRWLGFVIIAVVVSAYVFGLAVVLAARRDLAKGRLKASLQPKGPERLAGGRQRALVTTGGIPNVKCDHPAILHPREQTRVRPSGAEL